MSTIVITGAGSGIGAATAARLRADGHSVIGVDLRGAKNVRRPFRLSAKHVGESLTDSSPVQASPVFPVARHRCSHR
jgi:NAD(P)-dependent dehydrogenase (short-subunit alcohol dehydrogenase family)